VSELEIGGGGRELALALVEIERQLAAARPRAVRVRGFDDEALAAVLVAAKLGIEVRLEDPGAEPGDELQARNRTIMRLLAAPAGRSTLARR